MESEQEKKIREFWESLTPESLEKLLKETPLAKLNKEIPGDWKAKDDSTAIQPMNAGWLDEIFNELVAQITLN